MEKVMVIYMVQDRIAQRVQELMDDGEWAKAYDLVTENDRTRDVHARKRNWHNLDTIDLLLEYIDGVTV